MTFKKLLPLYHIKFICILCAALLLLTADAVAEGKASPSNAPIADEGELDAEAILLNQDKNNYTKEFADGVPQIKKDYIYEQANLNTLAHLHWAISILDLNDNENIDNFLKLTECKIFKRFSTQEFEWENIRKATREFITTNRTDFPIRFELVMPIVVEEYDINRSAFIIKKEDQLNSARLLELMASNSGSEICGDSSPRALGKYRKGLAIELSRPISLPYVPAPRAMAEAFVKERNEVYARNVKVTRRFNRSDQYEFRIVYLVLNIRVFTYKGDYQGFSSAERGESLAQVLGVLEGYEIYGDINRKNLFYSRSYVTKRDEEKAAENLNAELDLLKKRTQEKGILFN